MANWTRGDLTDCLAIQLITNAGTMALPPAHITVTDGADSAYIWLYHGYTEAIATATPGHFSIMTKGGAGGADHTWSEYRRLYAKSGTPVLCTIDATEAVGQTTLSTTNGEGASMTDGEEIFIEDSTLADSEWNYMMDKDVDADSVIVAFPLTNEKLANDEITSLASTFPIILPLAGVTEWMVLFTDMQGSGSNAVIFGEFREVTDFV